MTPGILNSQEMKSDFNSKMLTKYCTGFFLLHIVYFCVFQPLQVKCAIAVEGLKGYIYIEAYKQTHVKQVEQAVRSVCLVEFHELAYFLRYFPLNSLQCMKYRTCDITVLNDMLKPQF